ncbi:hypothetical protein X771_32145 [Mesorhizobium sp. LSJC277A00]|nr:hypothetical protein X771_32145 [Mesorhizobium sp. LSJC277A00]
MAFDFDVRLNEDFGIGFEAGVDAAKFAVPP